MCDAVSGGCAGTPGADPRAAVAHDVAGEALQLGVYPTGLFPAANNMAFDFHMLGESALRGIPLFRHYGWEPKAFTFGYTQRLSDVIRRIGPASGVDLCRRPSGGGIVDHRNDWTYALAIPAVHPLAKRGPMAIYCGVHQALADALAEMGVQAGLWHPAPGEASGGMSCFERPSPGDVVLSGWLKVAGAAMKRTRDGVLIQGSLDRSRVPPIDDEWMLEAFGGRLIHLLEAKQRLRLVLPEPESLEPELSCYRTPAWNELR